MQTPQISLTERQILARPETFFHPAIAASYWAAAKAARGQSVDLVRIGHSRHLVVSDAESLAAARIRRIRDRVRDRAALLGQTRPAPLIDPGAA